MVFFDLTTILVKFFFFCIFRLTKIDVVTRKTLSGTIINLQSISRMKYSLGPKFKIAIAKGSLSTKFGAWEFDCSAFDESRMLQITMLKVNQWSMHVPTCKNNRDKRSCTMMYACLILFSCLLRIHLSHLLQKENITEIIKSQVHRDLLFYLCK